MKTLEDFVEEVKRNKISDLSNGKKRTAYFSIELRESESAIKSALSGICRVEISKCPRGLFDIIVYY